jgi:hypothetical protein
VLCHLHFKRVAALVRCFRFQASSLRVGLYSGEVTLRSKASSKSSGHLIAVR